MEPASKPGSSALLDSARELVSQLEAGNESDAEKLIEELGRIREQTLFQQLSKRTRELHDALNSFVLDSRSDQRQRREDSQQPVRSHADAGIPGSDRPDHSPGDQADAESARQAC